MKIYSWCFIIFQSIGLALSAKAQTSADTAGGYKLVWADEFNNEGAPDATNWVYEKGFARNHEAQWYQSENAFCHDGLLVIEAKKVHLPNPTYIPGSTDWRTSRQFIEYTSTSMNTRGLHSWQYGRMVMRAKIPVDSGMWPAFWALGVKHPWPSNGEIDIMEYYRNRLLANIACGTSTPNKAKWYSLYKLLNTFGPDWSERFHVWRMDWDENAISLYVDDLLMNRVELDKLVNQDGSSFNPFKQPEYLLLNLAIGGDNGGNPSSTRFPIRYEVDYVRVYRKDNAN